MTDTRNRLKFLEQLKPVLADSATYGRMYADLHDLLQAGQWLTAELDRLQGRSLTSDEIETFLIDLDIAYIQHASFHLKSLHADVNATLAGLEGKGD
jgi:hypothetical protein